MHQTELRILSTVSQVERIILGCLVVFLSHQYIITLLYAQQEVHYVAHVDSQVIYRVGPRLYFIPSLIVFMCKRLSSITKPSLVLPRPIMDDRELLFHYWLVMKAFQILLCLRAKIEVSLSSSVQRDRCVD